ncbi:MAG: TonB-dependent receptor [Bacteroidetes bacterium]|nr:TonB-dependent receptor [Bacteroidota bacterium]
MAHGQVIRLDVDQAPLREALETLRAQAAVDVVYAERQVEGVRVTCRYDGRSAERALRCLLAGTSLRAERVRRRQYVLAEAPPDRPTVSASAGEPSRGMLLGFVADATTDESLPGAHVYLPALQVGTTTNDAGYFALPALPRRPYVVRFSYLGYAAQDTLLTPGMPTATIGLRSLTVHADEVVVEAQRGARRDLSTVPGLTAVPVQDLQALPSFPGESDLMQALQWLPGVQKAAEVNGGLIIRGGAPDQNLYLLDGAPVYFPWHAFSLISTFQTETFKDIKLYRGSLPAEHGGRLAAVLDVEMRDGSQDEARVLAAISPLSGRFIAEAPLGQDLTVMVSGRRSYLDLLLGTQHAVEEDGRRDTLRTGYYFYDTSAKLTWRPRLHHRLSLSYYGGRDNLDVRLPFDLSFDPDEWLRPADLFFEVEQDWGNRLVSLRHQYLPSQRVFVTTTAYRSSYRADEGVFLRPTDASSVRSDYRVRLQDYGLRTDVDYYPSVTHQVRAGVEVVGRTFKSFLDADVQRSLGVLDTLNADERQRAFEVSGYVQDTWQPAPRWTLKPGLRLAYFSGGRHVRLSPRASLRYALVPDRLALRAGGGLQWQYLHRLRDRFSFLYDLVSSRWVPASDAVRPASSRQVAVGAESTPTPWLTLGVDGYWRTSSDVLLPRDVYQTKEGLEGPGIEVGTLLGQYMAGEARAYGLEVTARAEDGPWRAWMSYAGGRSRTRPTTTPEPDFYPTRFEVPRSLRTVLSYRGPRWMATLSNEWRSGYPLTVPVARYAAGDPLDETPTRYLYRPEINNGRLPPYFRLDLTVGYRFRVYGAQMSTKLHFYNVTNRRNVIDRTYDPAPEGGVAVEDRRGLFFLPLFELQVEL